MTAEATRAPREPRPGRTFATTAWSLALIAPLSLATWLAGAAVLRRGVRRWQLGAAAALAALPLVVIGPGPLAVGAGAQVATYAAPPLRPSWAFLGAFLALFTRWAVATAPLGVPVGLAAAAINRPSPTQMVLPSSDPSRRRQERRRQQRDLRRADRLAVREATDPASRAFGAWLGGDLDSWKYGRLVCLPEGQLGLATLLLGQPAVGKSNASGHLARLAALERRHVALIDGKGGDGLDELVTEYVRRVWPDARIRSFPAEPFDLWRGSPMQLVAKLSACWTFSAEAEFYRNVAELALRLALAAPTGQPVTSMRALVDRLEPNALGRLWQGHQTELSIIRDLKPRLADVAVRVSNLAASLGVQFDGGWSWEDCDVALVTIPTLANAADADAAMRILVADYGQYLTSPKRRPGDQRDLLLFDEFAALEGGRRSAINLVERSRSAGAGVILSAQSDVALGDADERERLKLSASAIIEFRSPMPASPALAGTVRDLDGAWQANEDGLTGRATLTERHHARVDADDIRAAGVGVATIVSQGHRVQVKVLPPPGANNDLALPRRPFAVISRVPPNGRKGQGVTPRQEAPPGHTVDPSGRSAGRRHRLGPVAQEQPPDDRDNQEARP